MCQEKKHSNLFETKSPLSSWPLIYRIWTFAWIPTDRVTPRGCQFGLPYCPAIVNITLSLVKLCFVKWVLLLGCFAQWTLMQSLNHTLSACSLKVIFNASFWGHFLHVLLAFPKFLKTNERFTLKMDSDFRNSFIGPINSRTSRLYCMWQLASRLRLLLTFVSQVTYKGSSYMEITGLALPVGLLSDYRAKAGYSPTTFLKVPVSHPAISIPLDPLGSTWLVIYNRSRREASWNLLVYTLSIQTFFYTSIPGLVSRWYKCLNIRGDYVRCDVYHLLHLFPVHVEVRVEFPLSECLLIYFLKLLFRMLSFLLLI